MTQKIISLLRVKNGEKYLPRLLTQLGRITDGVIVLDDGSTDSTKDICESCKFVLEYEYQELPFNGGRDRIRLHKMAEIFEPDWICSLDVDELFEESREGEIRKLLEDSPHNILSWTFPLMYLWNDERHYRIDGEYRNVTAVRIFRYNPKWLPKDIVAHSVASPPEVIASEVIERSSIRIKHFGYMTEEEREVKYNYYSDRDKDPEKVGAGSKTYEHIVQDEVKLYPWKDKNLAICLKINFAIGYLLKNINAISNKFPQASEVVVASEDPSMAMEELLKSLPSQVEGVIVRTVSYLDTERAADICVKTAYSYNLYLLQGDGTRYDVTTREDWIRVQWEKEQKSK